MKPSAKIIRARLTKRPQTVTDLSSYPLKLAGDTQLVDQPVQQIYMYTKQGRPISVSSNYSSMSYQ